MKEFTSHHSYRIRKVEETDAFREAILQAKSRRMSWGLFFKVIGVIFILASLVLYLNNRRIEEQMRISVKEVMNELSLETPIITQESMEKESEKPESLSTIQIGEYAYSGVIEIPDLKLYLPVIEGWDMQKLEIAPCNYSGSPYDEHFVLCAHDSKAHFGYLPQLTIGSKISFRDFNNKIWTYRVAESGVYPDTAIEEIKSEDWDLTLFTCTYGGVSRFAVRCELIGTAKH